ncbi:MAG: porin family protein [Sphingomonadales bacterium]|nr:MAG: porin family protein [Sphingomonadales bacterium]
MRSILIGLTTAVLFAAAPAMANPQGPYGGFNLGYAMSDAETDVRVLNQDYFLNSSITDIQDNFPGDLDSDSVTFGFFGGWMWDLNNGASFGFEGDLNWMNVDESAVTMREYPCCAPSTYTIGESLERNWLATIRARLGVDVSPQLFVYATGGFAFGDADYKLSFEDTDDPIALTTGSNDDTLTGWTAGVGGEFTMANGVSIRAEYLYVDLGDIDVRTDLSGDGWNDVLRANAEVTDNIFRLALVFDF